MAQCSSRASISILQTRQNSERIRFGRLLLFQSRAICDGKFQLGSIRAGIVRLTDLRSADQATSRLRPGRRSTLRRPASTNVSNCSASSAACSSVRTTRRSIATSSCRTTGSRQRWHCSVGASTARPRTRLRPSSSRANPSSTETLPSPSTRELSRGNAASGISPENCPPFRANSCGETASVRAWIDIGAHHRDVILRCQNNSIQRTTLTIENRWHYSRHSTNSTPL